MVQNERSIKEFLRTAPESILLKYKNGSSLNARVRRRLRQSLPGQVPDFERLAEELNMTPATMRRRLHEEGESYQSIKDQLRRDLACYVSGARAGSLAPEYVVVEILPVERLFGTPHDPLRR